MRRCIIATMQVTPVIFFQGNCKEAFEFYHKLLGGSLTLITDGEEIHAELKSDAFCLKGLDSKIANAEARKIELEVSGDDEPKLREIFDKLCEGGKAKHSFEQQPGGDLLARLFDKYGLDWMVTIHKK